MYLVLFISNFFCREMVSLKKEQDKYNRSEIKELTRKFKDKSEAQKEKRTHNKKHIDQSVKEIQKVGFS